jgi:hypothetical protein
MARPLFLWDLFLKLALGVFGIGAALLFWLFTPFFLLMNLLVSWHRLWRYFGVWNLVTFRFIMRRRNLFDTAALPTKQEQEPGDSRRVLQWNPLWRTARTADGTFNDLQDPLMGSANTRFARNFSLVKVAELFRREKKKDFAKLVLPNARQISKVLLTRDRFKPASSLNLLAAAWIQFQVHGWFDHRRRPPVEPTEPKTNKDYLPPIPLDAEDRGEDEDWTKEGKKWPGGEIEEGSGAYVMRIRRTEEDDSVDRSPENFPEQLNDLPLYRNTETHWWDGSQLYGSSFKRLGTLRDPDGDGKLKIEEGRLPKDEDRPGIDKTGFNNNYWAGLSLLHTLFALEHNAICDRLKRAYPDWADERLFQTARLINTALMAKIHTVEWTPAILGHPTLNAGMRANWWGIVTQRFNKILGRLKFLRDIQEEITGIPGSEQDHHAAAFAMTEEFVSVYRMHPLIPDDYRIYTVREDELKVACTFNDLQGDHTRGFIEREGIENVFYSFGVAHPGSITLKNFPRALQNFKRTHDFKRTPDGKDGKHVFQEPNGEGNPETLDLASVDIMRDRERAIPRYNNFRRMLLLLPCISYNRLVGVPLFPWFSSLTNREIEERKDWARELQRLYPNKEDLDLMLGLFAENRPKGFGFSDTAFRIFVLMAPRRLKSDRFITTDFNPDVYSQLGMDWIENNDFKSVLLRHYPDLAPALDDVKNAFTPWQRTERPSPDPVESNPTTEDPRPAMRRVAAFQMPIFGGAFIGWIIAAILLTWEDGRISQFFGLLFEKKAAYGAAIGAIIGGFSLASIYWFTQHRTGEITVRERVQSGAGWGATAGWFIGALLNLWINNQVFGPLTDIIFDTISSLLKPEAIIGALIGAGLGFIKEALFGGGVAAIKEGDISQIRRGVVVGWLVGAAWFLWHEGVASLGELIRYVLQAGGALGTREALIAAFVGALIGVAYGGKETIKKIRVGTAPRQWPWRMVYGVFFGGGIGAVVGILAAVYLGFAGNPLTMLYAAGVAIFLVIAGIAMVEVRDFLVRHNWPLVLSLLGAAVIGTALGALGWMFLLSEGDLQSLLRMGWNALDALTFHVVACAAIGATFGVALFLGGWLTLAALAGWLLGAAIEAMLRFPGDIFAAIFSLNLGTGLVIGAFLGAALMAFFVRPRPDGEGWMSVGEGWIVVGGVRGALWGFIIGTVFYIWEIPSAEGWGAFALKVFTSSPAQWGALIAALLAGAIWLVHGPEITWILRRSFWNFLGWFKFVGNRPLIVTPPRRRAWWKLVTWLRFFADRRAQAAKDLAMKNMAVPVENMWLCFKSRLDFFLRHSKTYRQLDEIPLVRFSKKFAIPIDNIDVSGTTSPDERSRIKTLSYRIQVHLYSVFSPMQPEKKGLPPISADPHEALKQAYRSLQRRAFDAPDLPPEYEGSPDLGSLAVRGPYSAYLQKVKDSPDEKPQFEWDLRELDEDKYELRKGLYSLGVRVQFCVKPHASQNTNLLVPDCIEYRRPDKTWRTTHTWDIDWQFAKKLALCAVTTHQSLVRHFNWVHLAGGEPFAIATRTCLPSDHPLCRLLWPHIYGTQQSNTVVTRGQMVEGGDFETIFSFTHKGMCDLFTETYSEFNLDRYDPRKDAEQRGVCTHLQNAGIETTSQGNLEDLFKVIHLHAKRYLLVYYENDQSINADKDLQDWLARLKDLIPQNQDLLTPSSLAQVARLLAQFIYLVTVEHDKCGSFLWNYQLWSHRQPCRVYEKGTREPLDVYQRLVNANFNLNVPRLSLMEDFSYLALDDAGAAAFRQFQNDLETLQKEMEKDPWAVWKIYPKMLEANINA